MRGVVLITTCWLLIHAASCEETFETLRWESKIHNPEQAVDIHQDRTSTGNASSQFRMGTLYATGALGVKRDPTKAILHYYFAALGGDTAAQMAMGFRHSNGAGVPRSCQTAVMYYELAANKVAADLEANGAGPLNERERISLDVKGKNGRQSSGGENEDIVDYYRHAAEKGDVGAQVALGQIFFHGARGVERNFKLSAKYYSLASSNGDPQAQAHLGHLLVKGLGVKVDIKSALGNFTASSEAQSPAGHNGLGYMHLHGLGVRQDLKQAVHHFTAAAEQGNTEALYNLGALHVSGVGVRRRDYPSAINYFTLAVRSSHTLAMHKLAQMNLHGIGTLKSCDTALHLFKAVAERGDLVMLLNKGFREWGREDINGALQTYLVAAEIGFEVAQANAAWLLENGASLSGMGATSEDYFDAVVDKMLAANQVHSSPDSLRLYELSALQGNVQARLKIGDFYYYGLDGVRNPNFEMAAMHYRSASDLQNAQATFNLGYMHQFGIGLPRDFWLAKRFYDSAETMTSEAKVPVSMALTVLWVHRIWQDFWTSPPPASEVRQAAIDEPNDDEHVFSVDGLIEALEDIEDDTVIAIVVFVVLCVVLYLRTAEQRRRHN